jgi:hypothetical protein
MADDKNDATKNLRPEDEVQETEKGLKVGALPKEDVMADFAKIAAPDKSRSDD